MYQIKPILQVGRTLYFKWIPYGMVFSIDMFDVDKITVHTSIFTGNVYNRYYISGDTFMSNKVKLAVNNERN